MYWQVYFHPVTRSAEILLSKIFERAKELYGEGYSFQFMLQPLRALFENRMTVEDYLALDEAMMQTVLQSWSGERDAVLSDLCDRFLGRRLLKYTVLEPYESHMRQRAEELMRQAHIDPSYYLEVDFPTDLAYDVYRPGGHGDEKLPILLYDGGGKLTEITKKSDIVRSISNLQLGKHHIYYPEGWLGKLGVTDEDALRSLLTD
jgi:hypothetical protein